MSILLLFTDVLHIRVCELKIIAVSVIAFVMKPVSYTHLTLPTIYSV